MSSKNKGKAIVAESSIPDPAGILKDIPEPIATLDLTDPKSAHKNYKTFVRTIVDEFRKEADKTFQLSSNGEVLCSVPVTPALNLSAAGFYTFDLKYQDLHLRVVGEKFQNWFRGIITHSGSRYEIENHPKVMADSSSLHIESRYEEMIGKDLSMLKVGYHSLIKAVKTLARLDTRQEKQYEICVAVIILMLFEAPRFEDVFQLCVKVLKEGRESVVGEKNKKLINNWHDISRDFFTANGDKEQVQLTAETSNRITKIGSSIRILCRTAWNNWLVKNGKQEKTRKWAPTRREQEKPSK